MLIYSWNENFRDFGFKSKNKHKSLKISIDAYLLNYK